MKTIIKWVGIILLNVFALMVALMPLGGFLFILAMTASGGILLFNVFDIGTQGLTDFALVTLSYGWKVYVGMVIITMFVMTTFTYQNCCVGINSFRDHLRHAGRRNLDNIHIAVLWPCMLYVVNRNLARWMMSWLHAVLGTFEYWFITTWGGVRFESWNLKEETVETTNVTPETVVDVLRDSLREKHD
jgi:hypothetical protein